MMISQKPKCALTKRRVLLVDDHPVIRHGLAMLINAEADISVCGQADTVSHALQEIPAAKPDLVIVDIALPGRDGIELIKDIAALYPQVFTLVFSTLDELVYAQRALRAGARGYVRKEEPVASFLEAIHQVLSGDVYLSESMRSRLFQLSLSNSGHGPPKTFSVDRLTDRELEVFRLIGDGMGTRQIAQNLSVSVSTVETHRTNLKEKFGLNRAPDLVRQAVIWLHQQQFKS